tara:strand:- start:1020 stop:1322 length:303 start_codon:yes stop_codon:yes gene_type:complete
MDIIISFNINLEKTKNKEKFIQEKNQTFKGKTLLINRLLRYKLIINITKLLNIKGYRSLLSVYLVSALYCPDNIKINPLVIVRLIRRNLFSNIEKLSKFK